MLALLLTWSVFFQVAASAIARNRYLTASRGTDTFRFFVHVAKGAADYNACFETRDAIRSINGYKVESLENDYPAPPIFDDKPEAAGGPSETRRQIENTFLSPVPSMPAY